jgi:hypothetical protein
VTWKVLQTMSSIWETKTLCFLKGLHNCPRLLIVFREQTDFDIFPKSLILAKNKNLRIRVWNNDNQLQINASIRVIHLETVYKTALLIPLAAHSIYTCRQSDEK